MRKVHRAARKSAPMQGERRQFVATRAMRKSAPQYRAARKSAPMQGERRQFVGTRAMKKSAPQYRGRNTVSIEIPAGRKSAVRKRSRVVKKSAPLDRQIPAAKKSTTEIISNHMDFTLFQDGGYHFMLSFLDLFVVIVVMILSLWLLTGTEYS